MENKLEQLLNSLIEKGWKPYGKENAHIYYGGESLREITSKESGLWQFVCENGMIKNANDYSWELYNGEHGQYEVYKNGYEGGTRWEQVDYEYRIIQSALCDEDKLEDFILSNIKIDEK